MTLPLSSEEIIVNDYQLSQIRDYWNVHIHDLEIATQPLGSAGFFQELADSLAHDSMVVGQDSADLFAHRFPPF